MIHHVRMIKEDLKPQRKHLSKHQENFSKNLISRIKAFLILTKK